MGSMMNSIMCDKQENIDGGAGPPFKALQRIGALVLIQ